MWLRLVLLNEDLVDRFEISTTICSNIFKTRIRFLAQTLGNVVAWLPKENVENMPKIFCKASHSMLRVIIDYSEAFIERPKSVNVQATTWFDYKLYDTVKFLIGMLLTGYVTFLSDWYSDRASDKFITADNRFYDCLDHYDKVIAERGFQIKEELMLKFCTLNVPPGARIKAQMTTAERKTPKNVANLRIHVELSINRT